jgi:hypothetical protein
LTGRKYELGSVVEKKVEEGFRVVNLKVVYQGLLNACSERGVREVGQKKELGNKEAHC